MGIFCSFTVANVRELAEKVARNEVTTVEDMPSYAEAMRNYDMKHEFFSLIPMRFSPEVLAMTTAEVRAMSERHGPLRAGAVVQGYGGRLFADIFGA
jgi:hypothetical protein